MSVEVVGEMDLLCRREGGGGGDLFFLEEIFFC